MSRLERRLQNWLSYSKAPKWASLEVRFYQPAQNNGLILKKEQIKQNGIEDSGNREVKTV